MANSRVFFSDLKTGKCSSTVEARMLRLWEAKKEQRGRKIISINMLMVDVNVRQLFAYIISSCLNFWLISSVFSDG